MNRQDKLKVNWICELPTHYNDFLFNRIVEDDIISLKVYYVYNGLTSHPWKTHNRKYLYRFFSTNLGIDFPLVTKSFLRKKDLFVIGGWNNLTMVFIILIRIIINGKYIIWTDTPKIKERNSLFGFFRSIWIGLVLKRAFSIWGTGKAALKNLAILGASGCKLKNFTYFTDNSIFLPNKFEGKNDKLIFLSSGRLVNSHKGFDIAIKALGILKMEIPSFNFHYYIAGVGKDEDILKNLCCKYNIESNVTFTGWLEPHELVEFYKRGDIFIHPARYEPYGVSILEAMASGLIVIGSDVTGAIVDRIDDRQNGFIHKSEDLYDLIDIVRHLILMDNDTFYKIRSQSLSTSEEWTLNKATQLIYKYLCVE